MREVYDCIIPAAGASSRMGAWKPLLPWGNSSLAETAVEQARAAELRILLVLGNRGEELRTQLGMREGLEFVENPAWERGMLGSIQAALPRVRSSAFFVAPVDMPFLEPRFYRLLLEAGQSQGGEGEAACFAANHGRPGHPVLIPARWIPEILQLDPAGMLKDFLAKRPRLLVELGSAAIFRDLDTPAAYEEARSSLETPPA